MELMKVRIVERDKVIATVKIPVDSFVISYCQGNELYIDPFKVCSIFLCQDNPKVALMNIDDFDVFQGVLLNHEKYLDCWRSSCSFVQKWLLKNMGFKCKR